MGSPPETDELLRSVVGKMPVPVLWLLGKAQSGKSSVVRAVTGLPHIEIGRGFKPCTQFSSLYAFPNEEAPVLRFLGNHNFELTDSVLVDNPGMVLAGPGYGM